MSKNSSTGKDIVEAIKKARTKQSSASSGASSSPQPEPPQQETYRFELADLKQEVLRDLQRGDTVRIVLNREPPQVQTIEGLYVGTIPDKSAERLRNYRVTSGKIAQVELEPEPVCQVEVKY